MAGYIGTIPVPQATESRSVYTATSNQTTFATGGYTPNLVSVFLNGVHLARADFAATNGTDVVLAAGAAADDTVEIIAFNAFEASSSAFTADVSTSGTFLPEGDTAAGDDAAIGYTAAEGLILTGQGSTNDVTIKNDADADVIEIPTGTVNVTMAGTLGVTGVVTSAGLTIGSAAITEAELEILDGATVTTTELNLIDGGTARGTTAVADGDGFLTNDGGTMRMTKVETLATYMGTKIGGGYEFIASSGVVSNVANIQFRAQDGHFDATKFDHYEFFLQAVKPVTDGVRLLLQTSTNDGGAYASTNGDYHAGTDDKTGMVLTETYTVGNDTNEYGVNGTFLLVAPHLNTYTIGYPRVATFHTNGGIHASDDARYARLAAEDTDAVRFLFTSGNITSGEISMFGIVNS